MTNSIERYYKNMSEKALEMIVQDLEQAMEESLQQWEGFCDDCKKGFDSYTEWEREAVEKNTHDRRQYFFLKKEIDFKAWSEMSDFLIEKQCFPNKVYNN